MDQMEQFADYWKKMMEANTKVFSEMKPGAAPKIDLTADVFKEAYAFNEQMTQSFLKAMRMEKPVEHANANEILAIFNESYQKTAQAWEEMTNLFMTTEYDPKASADEQFDRWKQFYFKHEKDIAESFKKLIITQTMVEMFDKLRERYMLAQGFSQKNLDTFYETFQLPSRKDIARLAGMMVRLEDKVDALREEVRANQAGKAAPAAPKAAKTTAKAAK
ncbi:MAG: hypothetical protein ACM3QZ_04620 [Solirubrobacterales bacterium]